MNEYNILLSCYYPSFQFLKLNSIFVFTPNRFRPARLARLLTCITNDVKSQILQTVIPHIGGFGQGKSGSGMKRFPLNAVLKCCPNLFNPCICNSLLIPCTSYFFDTMMIFCQLKFNAIASFKTVE